MYFSDANLEVLQAEHSAVAGKCQQLVQSYMLRNYKDARAQEFATQGFSRRLQTLVRCINNVFEVSPPALAERPTNNALSDAEINIQAFVFNMFAGLDNLAWILVKEKGLPIPKHGVGLGENKEVRHYLSNEFQDYLTGLNDWFNYLKKFRDALAHRIPLYIPLGIPNDKVEVYLHLGDRIKEATQQRDVAEANCLRRLAKCASSANRPESPGAVYAVSCRRRLARTFRWSGVQRAISAPHP